MTDFEVIFCQNLELVPQFDAILSIRCLAFDDNVEIAGSGTNGSKEQVSGDLPSHRAQWVGSKFCFEHRSLGTGMGITPVQNLDPPVVSLRICPYVVLGYKQLSNMSNP